MSGEALRQLKDFFLSMGSPTPAETGEKHTWDEGVITGYHPPEGPSWLLGIGYMKPIRKYTCQTCGYALTASDGMGFLFMGQKTCPRTTP